MVNRNIDPFQPDRSDCETLFLLNNGRFPKFKGFYGAKRTGNGTTLAATERRTGVLTMRVRGHAIGSRKVCRSRVAWSQVFMLTVLAREAGQRKQVQTEAEAKPFHSCKGNAY